MRDLSHPGARRRVLGCVPLDGSVNIGTEAGAEAGTELRLDTRTSLAVTDETGPAIATAAATATRKGNPLSL